MIRRDASVCERHDTTTKRVHDFAIMRDEDDRRAKIIDLLKKINDLARVNLSRLPVGGREANFGRWTARAI